MPRWHASCTRPEISRLVSTKGTIYARVFAALNASVQQKQTYRADRLRHAIDLVLVGVQRIIHAIHASFACLRQIRLALVPMSAKRRAATKSWETH